MSKWKKREATASYCANNTVNKNFSTITLVVNIQNERDRTFTAADTDICTRTMFHSHL